MKQFLEHYKKNQGWFWMAIETYAVALVFIVQAGFFDIKPPGHTVIGMMDDPAIIFGIAVIGTFTLTYSVWDFHWFYARPIMIGLLTLVWSAAFIAFLIHDMEMGLLISPGSVLAGGVVCRIVSYAFTGDE
ncbi:hypothetical protein [Secundilactobacillus muriivasis]